MKEKINRILEIEQEINSLEKEKIFLEETVKRVSLAGAKLIAAIGQNLNNTEMIMKYILESQNYKVIRRKNQILLKGFDQNNIEKEIVILQSNLKGEN